jgi:hypothetical protein
MQDNPNTDNQNREFLTDREDWELAFQPYEDEPYAALQLGFNVAMLRKHLEEQLFTSPQAIGTLDLAMEVLFPFTEFHNASFDLFIRFTEGKLTKEEGQMLGALGIRF